MDLGKAARETVVIHSVERELPVPAEPDEAWEAVADPERLGDWLGGDVELATRVEISLDEAEDGTLVRVLETSPMATLDMVGIPLPSRGTSGPTALALAFA